ncbi:uncharacterized protein LOC120344866 [Styela clava]|uniref:uncharacterized protein LOC120344866 n=1 Tax=Styela clava TaxID=7725 RepID=UPI00193A5BFD|nr:uncharacterized protein LOC120344866 [Styela clava]
MDTLIHRKAFVICVAVAEILFAVGDAGCHRPKVEKHIESGNLAEWSIFSSGEECTWVIYPPERYKQRKRLKLEIYVHYFNMTTNKKRICRKEFTQNRDQRLCLLEEKRYSYYLPGCKKKCEKLFCKNLNQFPLEYHFTASRRSEETIGFSLDFKFLPCIQEIHAAESQSTVFPNGTTVHPNIQDRSDAKLEIILPVIFGFLFVVGVSVIAIFIIRKRRMACKPTTTSTGDDNPVYQAPTYEAVDNGDLSSFNNHSYEAVLQPSPNLKKLKSPQPTYIDIGDCVSVSQIGDEPNNYEQIDFHDHLKNPQDNKKVECSQNSCAIEDCLTTEEIELNRSTNGLEIIPSSASNNDADCNNTENIDDALYDQVHE